MKKIYVAYRFKDENPIDLKNKLEKLSRIIEETTDYKTFIFFRDEQKWGKVKINIRSVAIKAIKAIRLCDAIIIEASEKANGAYFEAGCAKALGKKVIVIHKKGAEAEFLNGISDNSIEYNDFNDLKEKLKQIK